MQIVQLPYSQKSSKIYKDFHQMANCRSIATDW